MRMNSLEGKQAALLAAAACSGVVFGALIGAWLGLALGIVVSVLAIVPLTLIAARSATEPVTRLLRALEGAVASYRDGDFSLSLAVSRSDELGDLAQLHNALGQALREQRQHLAQRELLLETVVQNTPVALLLADSHGRVVYGNLAARHLFNEGRSLHGAELEALLDVAPEGLRATIASGEDALFSIDLDGGEESFHVSQRGFRLQGRPHRLYLFRRMTRELSRQEVATWKKVIRVVSHELNNSLAPISSLAYSGAEMLRRGITERLPEVFTGIGDRAQHLHEFIEGYARFARLSAPRPEAVDWREFIEALGLHSTFKFTSAMPERPGWFDRAQMEQVMINLLKNAHEAGSPPEEVELAVSLDAQRWRIEVSDRGSGMSEAVLANALLPFYSTKRSGSGLGLALAREMVEAHDGRISLANRKGGGLCVGLLLPAAAEHASRPTTR